MGAELYLYVVPYQADIESALQKLRQREFRAGRYNPVTPFPNRLDVGTSVPPQHVSIEQVLEGMEEDGTRSILDIQHASPLPHDGVQMRFCTAFPLADPDLTSLFGTTKPTRADVENCNTMLDRIERGSAIYVVLFDDAKPSEILFAGYSFD